MTNGSEHRAIILVEDDAGHALLIEKNLRRAGIHNEIIHFSDGTSAEAYLFGSEDGASNDAARALLIILDLNLPDMSGADILQRLKQTEGMKRTPVVILTTTDDQDEVAHCYDLGCDLYLTKPIDYERFAHAARQLGLCVSDIEISDTA